MAVDRNIYSRPPAAQSRRRGGGHLRRLWPAIPEREIEIDGNSSDAWRIVRHRGDVLGRIFAAPNGSYVYYRGPFDVPPLSVAEGFRVGRHCNDLDGQLFCELRGRQPAQ